MTKEERAVMEMALDALEDWNFTMRPRPDEDIITAMKKCLANDALEKKAENARELGLMPYNGGDYEPVAFEKTVCPFCTSEWVTAEQHDRNVDRVEQELVAITITGKLGNIYSFTGDYSLKKNDKVYTTPPQRKPLTEQEIGAILEDINAFGTRLYTFARAIEAAHGIKGEA